MQDERARATGENPPAPPRLKRRSDSTNEEPAATSDETAEAGVMLNAPALSTLRKLAAAEEPKRAQFVRIECQQKTSLFHFKVGGQLLKFLADNFASVKFVGYTPNMPTELTCDMKNLNYTVLVTYRPVSGKKPKADGELVAVDFIPDDWK